MDLKSLRTRTLTEPEVQGLSGNGPVVAIIKSTEDNYCPAVGVLRTRLTARIVTLEIQTSDVERLQRDPKLYSVEIAEEVYPAKPTGK